MTISPFICGVFCCLSALAFAEEMVSFLEGKKEGTGGAVFLTGSMFVISIAIFTYVAVL